MAAVITEHNLGNGAGKASKFQELSRYLHGFPPRPSLPQFKGNSYTVTSNRSLLPSVSYYVSIVFCYTLFPLRQGLTSPGWPSTSGPPASPPDC